jgi:hypothetical protein
VAKVDPDSTGLNPAWRTALVHTLWGTGWPEGTPESGINQLIDKVKADTQTVEALSPGAGSYLNEVCPDLHLFVMMRNLTNALISV